MKRMIVLFCLFLGITWGALPASAHSLSLVAAVSAKGNEVSVRLLDPYGAMIEGGTLVAIAAPPGGKNPGAIPLAEGPAGTYRGTVVPPAGSYELKLEASLGADLFRATLPNRQSGQDSAEQLLPMQPIDIQPGFNWGPILYLAAVVVLVTATAVAMLRKQPADDGAE